LALSVNKYRPPGTRRASSTGTLGSIVISRVRVFSGSMEPPGRLCLRHDKKRSGEVATCSS
jgi:hypothetical protein